ncbi:MAG: PTS fructose transporter subunit IIA [Burkholderiales bacterium]|nr:PTS fructose transporter subunit IIA [Burkholderiales bacterium]
MIGVLIIAHDTLPDSLVKAVTHVLGARPPQLETLSVAATDDPTDLLPMARERVRQVDTGEGVLVLSDIYGATPCNLACKLVVPGRVEVIAGVNLPMLVRAFTYREKGMDTMLSKAVLGGRDGVLRVAVDPIYAATRG